MNGPVLAVMVPLAAGAGLGMVFFGGLRLTVRWLVVSRRPMLLALASFLVRTAAVVAVFVWVGGGQWQRYAATLAGFLFTRIVLVRSWGAAPGTAEKS